ncbi:helix-turn-helix domain-containing protein [Paenibacillus profundus]|uniref:Helix-turn-helix domain-containing protein n=1 Tax=Paenibacillus profundus TaxID=1173085 RepID=A0ABS8YBS2_9BACL|nr:helix-turn-helix domain-containing protein [Paenibacillus profundus]MCE5168319.1 helix-turn-helix domain-containing protein [Paenibacillus profundus]
MEEKMSQVSLSEDEFVELLLLARQNNKEAITQLLYYFEKDIIYLSKFIKMPNEDAIQSIKLELLELIKYDSYWCETITVRDTPGAVET